MATPANPPPVDEQIGNDGSLASIVQPPIRQAAPAVAPAAKEEPAGEIASAEVINEGAEAEAAEQAETQPEVGDTIDDFELAKASITPEKKEVKKDTEEEKPDVTPKTEDKPVRKEVAPVKKIAKADKTDSRDYTNIPANLVPHFKSMSNDAYNTLKPLFLDFQTKMAEKETTIKQLQEGKVIIPDSYYENEKGYLLTPEFEEAAVNAQEAASIYQHWKQQLDGVRGGAKTYTPLVRNAQGQIVYGQPVDADAGAETTLMSLFNSAQNQAMQFQGKLNGIQESFKTQHGQVKQWVDTQSKQWFAPGFQEENNPLKLSAEQFYNALPKAFRNNPLARMFSMAMVTSSMIAKLLHEKGAGAPPANGAKPAAKKIPANRQPNENDLSGGEGDTGKGKNGTGDSIEDFQKAMEGAL